ncbi:MAG: hypothetical protein DYH17_15340 [Xanthomonadales bacterium PRO6]|nr:hypothetical protein [Xanthomonadales bacterium PRO6]
MKFLLIPLALALSLGSLDASADTLLVQRIERSKASTLPRAGASMASVEAQFGAPESKRDAVGQPPISRWIYPAFTVYFEYDHVVNAVVNKSMAEEKGPKPVPPKG